MSEEEISNLASSGPMTSGGMLEMMAGLLFVVFLIFALAWFYKRVGANTFGLSNAIKMLAAISLGNRDRIALIEVGEKHLLIGISPGRISTLHVFEEGVELENEQSGVAGDFASKLQTILSGAKQ